jgi:tRNA pseudouridine13 synthase
MDILNPLPREFQTPGEGIGGVIKARPEDFLVEEIPLYDPCGTGEHLYLRIEKTAVSHGEMLGRIRRHFGVREAAIGFAGMKDKVAVTRQTVSVHLPSGPPEPDLDLGHDRIAILWSARHTNKLRLGHLAGNRFSVRIREVDPGGVTEVRRRLEAIRRSGVANYFGEQRFGYRRNNQLLGAKVLQGDWRGIVDELLGDSGSPFPDYQRERRELFAQGRYMEAAALWTRADRNELVAANALRDGRSVRDSARSVGQGTMSFWVSALQSAVFNRVLDARLAAGTLESLQVGDLAWKHDNGACFAVTAAERARPELAERLVALEISPSGPLWGPGMTRPAGDVLRDETESLAATGLGLEIFDQEVFGIRGARRPLRVPVHNLQTDAGVDGYGPHVRVAFDLPGGAYATVLLREVMNGRPVAAPGVRPG